MKQSHQSLALTGLLAVVLAISGCASTQGTGETTSGSSSTGSNTGVYDSANSPSPDAAGIATGTAITAGSSGSSSASTSTPQSAQGQAGSMGASGSTGATASDADNASMQEDRGSRTAATAPATTPVPNSTVLAIEIMPATGAATEGDTSTGATGATGAAGATGAGQAYRVTVRMDDGSTQVITHNTTPDFRSGDRINVTSGAIKR
jgi:hypothetical protein